ncbi:Thioredoxin domain-containing protein PLP3A [Hibiscus syriacus]|uniref:Thioredoxin domain-containing protein PLP3A n=1 Tax=Hibiscus syriacus TaxID=106335 RepID=A0A6A3AGW7_HIBSY|nr:Thioredoxin domain-containing protein PLP3A [Hibiscus syriacus]
MDPDLVKSTLSNLAFGNVMAAAARDYQKEVAYCRIVCDIAPPKATEVAELLAQEKAQSSASVNEEVDLDELMDAHELRVYRILSWKNCMQIGLLLSRSREAMKRQGHGEYREIAEGDFLGEVTGSEKVICHFYHKEFYRCKLIGYYALTSRIMDKQLKSLAAKHVDTKFIKLDAENAPFFVTKLAVKTLPCVIIFRKGVAVDRLVGFQDLGGKADFATMTL